MGRNNISDKTMRKVRQTRGQWLENLQRLREELRVVVKLSHLGNILGML